MRRHLFRFLVVFVLFFSGPALAEEIVVDMVVAIVDGQNVTLSEVRSLAEALMPDQPAENMNPEELAQAREKFFRMALALNVNQKLVLNQAEKLGITVLDREVERSLAQDASAAGHESLQQMLDETGMQKSLLFEKKKENLLYRRTIERQLYSRVRISPREIRDYYDENIKDYQQPEQVKLRAITFFREVDAAEDTKVFAVAAQALAELKGEADFSETASKYSMDSQHAENGGDWGWVDRQGNVAAKAAFDLPINTISDVIITENSYWILEVNAKKPAQATPLRQVWGDIRRKLEIRKLNQLRDEWIDQLRQEVNIMYPLSIRQQLLD